MTSTFELDYNAIAITINEWLLRTSVDCRGNRCVIVTDTNVMTVHAIQH